MRKMYYLYTKSAFKYFQTIAIYIINAMTLIFALSRISKNVKLHTHAINCLLNYQIIII